MLITSLANPKVKAVVKLRDRKGRDEQGRIAIDGLREIGLALDGGVRIVELFVCEALLEADQDEVIRRVLAAGAQRLDVTRPVMEKLAFGQRVQGLLAVAERPHKSLADLAVDVGWDKSAAGRRRPTADDRDGAGGPALAARAGPTLPSLVAVLEGIEKPGNLGAVLRTADAAGISGLIVADGGTDLYNPNAIRASLGAIFTVPVCEATSAETLSWLHTGTWQIVTARVGVTKRYTEIDYCRPTAIVLGSEAGGLSDQWQGENIVAVSLPMIGSVDSLNVSATAAVLFYEALRQRS